MSDPQPTDQEYRLVVEPRPGYLHISVNGTNSADNVRKILGDVIATCARHGCARVLFEEHLLGPSIGAVEAFEIVSEGSNSARPIVQQVAYVDTNPEHDSSLLEFVETVAVNRGIHVRVFATVREAEAWLASLPVR
jgi:hypothetical protein